jgi:hypothetical protein
MIVASLQITEPKYSKDIVHYVMCVNKYVRWIGMYHQSDYASVPC